MHPWYVYYKYEVITAASSSCSECCLDLKHIQNIVAALPSFHEKNLGRFWTVATHSGNCLTSWTMMVEEPLVSWPSQLDIQHGIVISSVVYEHNVIIIFLYLLRKMTFGASISGLPLCSLSGASVFSSPLFCLFHQWLLEAL